MFVVDVPAIAISDNCRNGLDPAFSGVRLGGRDAEPANPDLILLDCVLGQYPRPTLHRLASFVEGAGHVRIGDADCSRNQPCDEVRWRVAPRPGCVCPTIHSTVHHGSGVRGVVKRSGCDELGEGSLHVETARLGFSKCCEQWAVGGTLANLLEATRFES